MKIGVVGAGAMGSVYGGLFTAAGHDVWLIDIWREHVETIREQGLRVTGASGERVVHPNAATDPRDAGRCDLVVIATKMHDLELAVRSAEPMLGAGTALLAIQNGLGSQEILGSVLGSCDFLVGIAGGFGASNPRPGEVHHNGMDRINVAEASGGASERLERVVEVWRRAGFNVRSYEDADRMVWSKYICNLAFSPVCGTLSLRIGQVLDNREACALAEGCATEAFRVARAKGIALDFADPVRRIHEFGRVIPDAMPSLLLDLLAGRPTEIEALNGALVREAGRVGLEAPTNAFLARAVRALEVKQSTLRATYGPV